MLAVGLLFIAGYCARFTVASVPQIARADEIALTNHTSLFHKADGVTVARSRCDAQVNCCTVLSVACEAFLALTDVLIEARLGASRVFMARV